MWLPLEWAKKRVVKWFSQEKNKKRILDWALPLVLSALRALARSTPNKYDNTAVDALDAWLANRK